MKRIVAASLLLGGTLFAKEASLYLGIGGGMFQESFSAAGIDEDVDAGYVRLKAGFGFKGGYAVEAAVNYAVYDKNVFSDNDGANVFVDINLLKAFDPGWGFYPYLKAGFCAGYMDVDRNVESTLGNGGFQAGAGAFIPLAGPVELELEVMYRAKSWERVLLGAEEVEMGSTSVEPYVGLNYRF